MKSKINISLGKTKKVAGYEIKKMPLGAYLKATDKIKELPENLIKECFPGATLNDILENFVNFDEKMLVKVASTLLTVVPEYMVGFIGELTGISKDKLLDDENIGFDGLINIIKAFIEVNNLGECVSGVREIRAKIKSLINQEA